LRRDTEDLVELLEESNGGHEVGVGGVGERAQSLGLRAQSLDAVQGDLAFGFGGGAECGRKWERIDDNRKRTCTLGQEATEVALPLRLGRHATAERRPQLAPSRSGIRPAADAPLAPCQTTALVRP
jgi:hypothetical protein